MRLYIFTVNDGGQPRDLFEQSAKIGIIGDADRGGDMIDRRVGFSQKLLRLLDALAVDVFGHGTSTALVKALVQDVFGNVKRLTQMWDAQVAAQIILDIRGGKGNKIAVIDLDGVLKENVRKKIAQAVDAFVREAGDLLVEFKQLGDALVHPGKLFADLLGCKGGSDRAGDDIPHDHVVFDDRGCGVLESRMTNVALKGTALLAFLQNAGVRAKTFVRTKRRVLYGVAKGGFVFASIEKMKIGIQNFEIDAGHGAQIVHDALELFHVIVN